MAIQEIDAPALKQLLEKNLRAKLLCVEVAEVFTSAQLGGSICLPVLKMSFLDDVAAEVKGKDVPVVVYGTGPDSGASRFAAERLERAGYEEIYDFRGGVAAWREAGFPIVEGAPPPSSPHAGGKLELDTDASELRWAGRNIASAHEGTVGLKEGSVELADGVLQGGRLVLDMGALSCTDLTDEKANATLLKHLQADDFFDVEHHPEASVELREVKHDPEADPGRPNYSGTAELTLRGITKPIAFTLTGASEEDDRFSLQGPLRFDRTEWGVVYGSAQVFKWLGMHLVNDHIDLDLRLHFGR
ncbi:MAG: YceI family protein [Opitutales bacterium]